jgi:eukaryotic-like serine/threonine-protein kinase
VSQADAPPASVSPGDVLAGRYLVERVIASGGMGVIFAARHQDLDQQVAIKVLRPDILTHGDALKRFVREARTAARLQNEHVVRVFDVGTLASGVPFMVMEYLSGLDLEQLMSSRIPLSVRDVVDYALQTLEAIAEAHAMGVVHRDLKPANLFLANRSDGTTQIKVLDFGISKSYGDQKDFTSTASQTTTANLVGSPAYMSPEQVRDPKNVDSRADIWAIGTIMHELLMGQTLFQGETVGQTFANVLQSEIKPIRSRRDDVPPELDRAILRCLMRDPARRYADAAELARDLYPFGSSSSRLSMERVSSVLAISGGSGTRSLVVPSRPSDPAAQRAPASRARKLAIGIGVILSVAIGGFGLWWVGHPDDASATTEITAPARTEHVTAQSTAATTAVEVPPATTPSIVAAPSAALNATAAPRPQKAPPPGRPALRTNLPKKGATPIDVVKDRR